MLFLTANTGFVSAPHKFIYLFNGALAEADTSNVILDFV